MIQINILKTQLGSEFEKKDLGITGGKKNWGLRFTWIGSGKIALVT